MAAMNAPPEHVRTRPVLRKKIWERMHLKDKNFMAIVCGDTGSGKSEFALRLCELIDPDFGPEQIVFTIEDFLQLVNEDAPTGSAILFDEVGVALSHATHYDSEQIKLNHVLETWREQNRMLVMTSPHIMLIQKASRGLLHAQMDMQDIDREQFIGKARYRFIDQNTDTGELYKKYPRLRDPSIGQRRKFKHLNLYKPSPELVEPYQKMKREFNDQLNQEVLEEAMPDEEETSLSPSEVADLIVDEGRIDEYLSINQTNKIEYVDADLLSADFALSTRKAKKAKKLLQRWRKNNE